MLRDVSHVYLQSLAAVSKKAAEYVQKQHDEVVNLHLDGVKAATPRSRPIRFPKRR